MKTRKGSSVDLEIFFDTNLEGIGASVCDRHWEAAQPGSNPPPRAKKSATVAAALSIFQNNFLRLLQLFQFGDKRLGPAAHVPKLPDLIAITVQDDDGRVSFDFIFCL